MSNYDAERENALKHAFAVTVATGGVRHSVYACRDYGIPAVALVNDEDPEYVMWFGSRERVDAFISELRAAADEAFGD